MKSVRIKNDYIYDGPSYNEARPFSGNALLRSISDAVLRLRKHHHHVLKQHAIYIDDDSLSGETLHHHRIHYNAKGLYEYSPTPSIVVSFLETSRDDYDYKRMVTIDTSTAYKRGRRVPPKEMAFKTFDVQVSVDKGNPLSWVEHEAARLTKIAEQLDTATSSLSAWIDSGFGMRIVCRGSVMCSHSSTIAPQTLKSLASDFATVEEFSGKLKCSKCGSKRLFIELGGSDAV